jgi:hypothetical protein
MRAGIILTVKEGIIKYVDPKRQAEASLPNSPLRHAIASSQEVEEYIQYKIEQFSTAKERIAHLTSELRENPISGQDEDNEKKKKKGTTTTTTTTDGRPSVFVGQIELTANGGSQWIPRNSACSC